MAKHLIIQHQGKTLYAGKGKIETWKDSLLAETKKDPDKTNYCLTEVEDFGETLPIRAVVVSQNGAGRYKMGEIESLTINLDDRSRSLLSDLLKGDLQ